MLFLFVNTQIQKKKKETTIVLPETNGRIRGARITIETCFGAAGQCARFHANFECFWQDCVGGMKKKVWEN